MNGCDDCRRLTGGDCGKHRPAGVYDVIRLNEQVECDRGFHVWTPQVRIGDSVLIRCVRCRHEERFAPNVPAVAWGPDHPSYDEMGQ